MSVLWDYSYDTNGFFTPDRRLVLEQVSGYLEARIGLNSAAITPSGGNTWSWLLQNPQTGGMVSLTDPSAAAGQIVIYVGAQNMALGSLGVGSPVAIGSYGGTSQAWYDLIEGTNTPEAFKPFAGTISFNSSASWYFGTSATVPFGKSDFFTAASHELGHILGIAIYGSPGVRAWNTRIDTGTKKYLGANGTAAFGGQIPLSPDLLNFQSGTSYLGSEFLMDPEQAAGTRKFWTVPELAVLTDLGYLAIPEPGVGALLLLAIGWGSLQIAARRRSAARPQRGASGQFGLYFGPAGTDNTAMRARRNFKAFTLVEVLVVIAVVSALGGAGYVATQGLKQTSDETKLEQDVAELNSAVQLYRIQTSGSLGTNAQDVLAHLQTRADAASASRTIGLKSSVLDERVEAPQDDPETWQSSTEAASRQLRAYWDATNKVFYTARSGSAGIKKFRFKEVLPEVAATEARTPVHLAAATSKWVWDSANPLADTSRGGASPVTGSIYREPPAWIGQSLPGGYWTVGPSGVIETTYVYREAGYSSRLALFSLEGMGSDVYNLDTPEGQRQFLLEALRRIKDKDRGDTLIDVSSNNSATIANDPDGDGIVASKLVVRNDQKLFRPGDTVAAILIPNDSVQNAWTALNNLGTLAANSSALQNLAQNSTQKFPLTSLSRTNSTDNSSNNFPFFADQYASLGQGTNSYAMEDTRIGSDHDYQDLIFKTVGMTSPEGTNTRTIDPVTYYGDLGVLDTVGTGGGMTLRQALTTAGIIQ